VALALVLLATTALYPTPAYAVLGIPGPDEIVSGIFKWLFKTFFGIDAKIGRRALEFLVAHPIYSDKGEYPELNALRSYVTAGAWSIWALVVTIAALRYWASGFTQSGSYEAIQGMARGAGAAAAIMVYPQVFEWLLVSANLFTHALLDAPGVRDGITKLLTAALVSNVVLGPGAIATAIAVIVLILLVVTKIVLAAVLAVLFISGALAIALWPLEETSWMARTWLQTLIAVALWPVIWALCFAAFAVIGKAAFSVQGSFGKNLIEPWVTVAALYVAFHVPRLVCRQAMSAGITPSLGGGISKTMIAGRTAGRMGGHAAGRGAEGISGRFGAASAAKSAGTTAAKAAGGGGG